MTRGPDADRERLERADAPLERTPVDRRLRERARQQLLRVGLPERAAQDAGIADPPDEGPRVDVVERNRPLLGEPAREARPERARHDAFALHTLGLVPGRIDAVVPDQRVGEAEHLRDVARVGD